MIFIFSCYRNNYVLWLGLFFLILNCFHLVSLLPTWIVFSQEAGSMCVRGKWQKTLETFERSTAGLAEYRRKRAKGLRRASTRLTPLPPRASGIWPTAAGSSTRRPTHHQQGLRMCAECLGCCGPRCGPTPSPSPLSPAMFWPTPR